MRPFQSPSRRRACLGGVVVALTFCLLVQARLWRPDTVFTIAENVQIGEAQAWWDGRLDLPERKWDTALKDGRIYSHFPPMFSFVAACLVPLFHGVPHAFVVLGLVLPVLLLSYALFLNRTGSACWGAVLAIGFVCGTSLLPVMDKTLRGAGPFFVNQTLSTTGLLIILWDCFGRRRVWPAAAGLVIAALSRQFTLVYLLPVCWAAIPQEEGGRRFRRVLPTAAAGLVVVSTLCLFNLLKFGHPLDSGYMNVYDERPEDSLSRDARAHGLFSPRYVPRNLYYSNVGFPEVHQIEMAGKPQIHLRPNRMGTGIWWTTPLLLWVFLEGRAVLREPGSFVWLAAAGLVYAGLLFYHSTGYEQRGYNRYSLDYIPVLLALIAPYCVIGRRRWITVAMVAWGVAYFAVILAMPNVRIW